MCYFNEKEYIKAIASFDIGMRNNLKPFDPMLHYYKGLSLYNLKSYDLAVISFKNAIFAKKNDPLFH